jgi:hypothetical protein
VVRDSVAPLADAMDPQILLSVLARVKDGDFTVRMPSEWTGVAGEVATSINDVIISNQLFEIELARVSRAVGVRGELSERASITDLARSWTRSIYSCNCLIEGLVGPTIAMRDVIAAIAAGDFTRRVSVDVNGDFLDLKGAVNAIVDQLSAFVGEVTRVCHASGDVERSGDRAPSNIKDGWKDLTANVNHL